MQTYEISPSTIFKTEAFLKDLATHENVKYSKIVELAKKYRINNSIGFHLKNCNYITVLSNGAYKVTLKNPEPFHARRIITETNHYINKKGIKNTSNMNIHDISLQVIKENPNKSIMELAGILYNKAGGHYNSPESARVRIRRTIDSMLKEQPIDIKNTIQPPITQNDIAIKNTSIPPDINDVRAYCNLRKNNINPDVWYDYYQSKGWMIGKSKMKDWQAAIRTWERNQYNKHTTSQPTNQNDIDNITGKIYQEGDRIENKLTAKLNDKVSYERFNTLMKASLDLADRIMIINDRLTRIESVLFPPPKPTIWQKLNQWQQRQRATIQSKWNKFISKLIIKNN